MNGNEYGYVRVSSTEQNEDRQLIALKKIGVDDKNIYMDIEYRSLATGNVIHHKETGHYEKVWVQ